MAKKHLEIEKKYLLRRVPDLKYAETLYICQFYLPDGSRIRETVKYGDIYKPSKKSWVLTKKKRLKPGVYEEFEKNISQSTYKKLRETAESGIDKRRYVTKKYGKVKWEIDEYMKGLRLVTAEVELPTETYYFNIPEEIEKELLLDVTEYYQFTNKALSKSFSPAIQL